MSSYKSGIECTLLFYFKEKSENPAYDSKKNQLAYEVNVFRKEFILVT